MKTKDLRVIDNQELELKVVELKKELIKLNAQIATGSNPKNPKQVRDIKKTVAKILTIKRERLKEKTK
jgi:large subunit ribosomal protein L29